MKEQIEKEEKILSSLYEQLRELSQKIERQRNLVKELYKKYNDSRVLSLKEIIQCTHLEVMSSYFRKWCNESGFINGGQFLDTEEYTIRVLFCVNDRKRLRRQLMNIQRYAKIASPRKDGLVWMGVLENSLSCNGSYHICYEKDKGYKIYHTYKKFITGCMSKDELFEWGCKNIPYTTSSDNKIGTK